VISASMKTKCSFFILTMLFLHKSVTAMNKLYKASKNNEVVSNVILPFCAKVFEIRAKVLDMPCKVENAYRNLKNRPFDFMCFENPREDYRCLICFEYFKNYKAIFVLPCACKHPLCFKCVRQIERCPFCRAEYSTDQVQKTLFKKLKIKKLQDNEPDITKHELRKIGYWENEIESLKQN